MVNFRLVRHLWLFLVVAEEQNFGRAARRLAMSQPPLSEQIQALEQALKVKLFDRSRRGAQLTPIGEAILPAVRKFADQLENLELAVREAVAGRSGVLTIGAISTAMLDILPPLIERLKVEHADLTVSVREIDSVEAIPLLESGDIDLAFARLEGEFGGGIQSMPLAQDRLMVALPRSHPKAESGMIRLSTLADEDFVMFSREVSPVHFDSLVACCRENGFSPRVLHRVRSVASQIAFVGCGQGIALVPGSLRKIAPESVVLRPLKESLSVVTTAVAWNTTRMGPVADSALEILRERSESIARKRLKK